VGVGHLIDYRSKSLDANIALTENNETAVSLQKLIDGAVQDIPMEPAN
jgi:hypothetical protein